MANTPLFRLLFPDAPLDRRTEGDTPQGPDFGPRARAMRTVKPGLDTPSLVSSCAGSIDRILFCFPNRMIGDPTLVPAYRSVISALRVGTQFIVVHNEIGRSIVEGWFSEAGHPPENVELVPMPDFVQLTDWAEDGYVSLKDASDGSGYLMEPWEFLRSGDALIADAVEEHTDVAASSAPLIFQGGNCLVGDDFWMMGADYFADTLDLLHGGRPPVMAPPGEDEQEFARSLFSKYVDAERELILVGTPKPIPLRQWVGEHRDGTFLLHRAADGAGTYQPIFHIDMFVTLIGRNDAGAFEVLVGDPRLADDRLKTKSPFALAEVYDAIARGFEARGFAVGRNPLVHRETAGKTYSWDQLRQFALQQPPDEAMLLALGELAKAGATADTPVELRNWHHITWNNCLVENSPEVGKHVYIPSFGLGDNDDLAPLDADMQKLWETRGFEVHALADFNAFAARQGVVHCIKKYVTRGG
jgi:hypothetical protein